MKKFVIFIILLTMFFSMTLTVSAETVSDTRIAEGVVQKEYTVYSSAGRQQVFVLEVDLKNPRVGIKLLTDPEGVSYLENVKKLANTDERVIAAVNGDFFAWYSKDKSRGSAVGLNYSDGEMITSAPVDEELASLVFTDSGAVLTQYFKPKMYVITENDRKEEINSLNKFDSLAKLAMYNSHWGKSLYCDGGNMRIAVVEDDEVVKIVSEEGEVDIPEKGYLIAGLADLTDFFSEGIAVGDTLETELYFEPYFDDIETAIGGGTVLVKNGAKAKITHMRYGRDFRTAAGVSRDNETLYLITVDKNSKSVGMTLDELQKFMLDIGVYDGINLDGGGSTQMVARSYGDSGVSYVNKPENNYYRPVNNALAVTVKGGERGELEGITLKTDVDSLNIGETVNVSFVPYDELYYPLEADPKIKPKYTFGGVEGETDGTSFTPAEKGELKITVKYDGYKAEKTIKVYDPDKYMNADSVIYRAKTGETVDVKVTAITLSGEQRTVPLDEISISVSDGLATVSNGVMTAKKSGFGVISFNCGEFSFSSYISVDGVVPQDGFAPPTNFHDGFEKNNAYALSYPDETPSAYKISDEKVSKGKFSGKLWFDFDTDITDLQSANAVFENPPLITSGGTELSIEVYSPGFEKTVLKAMITDKEGTVRRISLGNLKSKGWNSYSVTLPNDIALPAKLSRLYVVESAAESKERGAIYFDSLELSSAGAGDYDSDELVSEDFIPSVILTAGVTQTDTLLGPIAALNVNKAISAAPVSYSFSSLVSAENTIEAKSGKTTVSGNVLLIQYKDTEQLEESLDEYSQDTVVITASSTVSKNTLKKALEDYSERDIFVVFEGEAPLVEISENVRFVTLPALTPSIVKNQKTFVTLEIGTSKNKTVYRLNRVKLWE